MSGWLVGIIQSAGSFGVGILMFVENVVVFIPSELIMPLAGFYSAVGRVNFWAANIAGTIGAHLGSLGWYWIGWHFEQERFERFVKRHGIWLGLEPRHIEKATGWFERHGSAAILTGRLVPGIRTFISVPAGFSRMPLVKFVPLSLVGSFVFNLLLSGAGRLLGSRFHQVSKWVHPITLTVIGLLFGWWLYRVVRMHFKRSRRS